MSVSLFGSNPHGISFSNSTNCKQFSDDLSFHIRHDWIILIIIFELFPNDLHPSIWCTIRSWLGMWNSCVHFHRWNWSDQHWYPRKDQGKYLGIYGREPTWHQQQYAITKMLNYREHILFGLVFLSLGPLHVIGFKMLIIFN